MSQPPYLLRKHRPLLHGFRQRTAPRSRRTTESLRLHAPIRRIERLLRPRRHGAMLYLYLRRSPPRRKTACGHLHGKAPVLMNCAGIWSASVNPDTGPIPNPTTRNHRTVPIRRSGRRRRTRRDGPRMHRGPNTTPASAKSTSPSSESIRAAVHTPVILYQPPLAPKCGSPPNCSRKSPPCPASPASKSPPSTATTATPSFAPCATSNSTLVTGAEMLYYANLYAGFRAVIGGGCNHYPRILTPCSPLRSRRPPSVLAARTPVDMLFAACTDGGRHHAPPRHRTRLPRRPHVRPEPGAAYGQTPPLDDATYTAYKALLEKELKNTPNAPSGPSQSAMNRTHHQASTNSGHRYRVLYPARGCPMAHREGCPLWSWKICSGSNPHGRIVWALLAAEVRDEFAGCVRFPDNG